MSEETEIRLSLFAEWFNQQLRKRQWTQGKLIAESGTKGERLSQASVSRYSTGSILPDAASCQKIARAFDIPVDVVLRKAGIIDTPFSNQSDWLERAIDDLNHAVETGLLPEDIHSVIIHMIRLGRERAKTAAERKKGTPNERAEEAEHYSPL